MTLPQFGMCYTDQIRNQWNEYQRVTQILKRSLIYYSIISARSWVGKWNSKEVILFARRWMRVKRQNPKVKVVRSEDEPAERVVTVRSCLFCTHILLSIYRCNPRKGHPRGSIRLCGPSYNYIYMKDYKLPAHTFNCRYNTRNDTGLYNCQRQLSVKRDRRLHTEGPQSELECVISWTRVGDEVIYQRDAQRGWIELLTFTFNLLPIIFFNHKNRHDAY